MREQILEVFARMNSTGRQLNAQELRNARFHGEFKQSAYGLAYEQLENWQAWKTFTVDQLAQMREVEFVSELMSYVIQGLRSKSPAALDRLYERFDEEYAYADEVANRVRHCLKDIEAAISPGDELALPRFGKQGWLYPMFALIHDLTYGHPLESELSNAPVSLTERDLFRSLAERHLALSRGGLSEEVLKATRGAATDAGSRTIRLRYLTGEAN